MKKIAIWGFLVWATVAYVTLPTASYAVSLDDEEEDAEDLAYILTQAKRAAQNEAFDKAEAWIKKAKLYGVKKDAIQETERFIAGKKAAKAKREKEMRLAAQRQAQQQYSNFGLPKNMCYRTSGNYALNKYCNTGSCDGFASNYALYSLCKENNPYGFHGSNKMANIQFYLSNGGILSSDYFSDMAVYQSGKFNGSFQDRKNFILYLMSGMILMR